jgi:hypothetical protein
MNDVLSVGFFEKSKETQTYRAADLVMTQFYVNNQEPQSTYILVRT